MAHVFDAEFAQRAAIRNAIIARLAPLLRTSNPALYLHAIGTLPRPFRGEGDEQGQAMLQNETLKQAPSVVIALGRCNFAAGGGAAVESDGELEVAVYCASQHMTGTVDGRLYGDAISAGDVTADPGVFVMLQHVRELLAGQELGLEGVNELRCTEEDEALTFDNITVWEQRYKVTLNTSVNPARSVTQLLTSIEANTTPDELDGEPGVDPFVTTVTAIDPPEEP